MLKEGGKEVGRKEGKKEWIDGEMEGMRKEEGRKRWIDGERERGGEKGGPCR